MTTRHSVSKSEERFAPTCGLPSCDGAGVQSVSVRPEVGGSCVAGLMEKSKSVSLRPTGAPSHFSLRAQREVTTRKGTRGSCSAHSVSAVPCATRHPRAGANSAIHGLGHARLAPAADCVARHEHGRLRGEMLGDIATVFPRLGVVEAKLRPGWPPSGAPASQRTAGGTARTDAHRRCACCSIGTRMYRRATPEAERELEGQDARRATGPGWPSLWLLSLGHSRESDSGRPQVGLKALLGSRIDTPR